jgi:hypothetical protein
MTLDLIKKQQEKDREELAAMPPGKNKPISWCSEHDCQMGTCFALHYPNSSVSFNKQEYHQTPIVDEDVPKVITSEEFKEDVRKAINQQIDDQEKWVELWRRSRK